jgi:hypothetical protein
VLFDLVAEVTQTCTAKRGADLFDMTTGATIVIDPAGVVRYVIYKRPASEERLARQHAAMKGPLAPLWEQKNRRFVQRKEMVRRLHGM